MINKYIKFLVVAVACGIMTGMGCIGDNADYVRLYEIVKIFGFEKFYICPGYFQWFFEQYFPIIIFQIIFGTYIYRRFCSASVYYFLRCNNRTRWFVVESIKLYLYTVTYIIIMLFTSVVFVSVFKTVKSGTSDVIILFYYLVLQSLWLFAMTVLINIISIKFNSMVSVVAVLGGQMLCASVFVILQQAGFFTYELQKIYEVGNSKMQQLVMKLNPMSNIIIKYHSSKDSRINKIINDYGFKFDINISVWYLVITVLLVVILGVIIVNKTEFITLNKENQN